MSVAPSCPALIVHDDDPFRKALIAALDQNHFTVTSSTDGPEALKALNERCFSVVLLGVDLKTGRGLATLEYLRDKRRTSLIIVGIPNPKLRDYAKTAVETLVKPVDPSYVARRARVYCGH